MKPRIKAPVVSLRILPSAMTVAAICLGLTSVKMALDNRPTESMAFLAVAAILDALDGRIARILKATSRMGEEIDSLADAVNFGVAPAFIVYATLLSHSRVGWIVVLLYAVCIVLRLARFNAMLDVDKPGYEKEYFVGMPAPAGAIGAIGPLAAKMQFGDGWWTSETAVVIWMIGVSLLVVSTLPMRKIHTFAVSPNMVAPLLAALAILVAASILYGYITILVIIVAYVIHIPFAIRTRRFLADHPEVWDDKPRQQRAARRAIRRAQPHRRSICASACAGRAAEMTQTETAADPPLSHLRLTARLNTSAMDSRRGVVRLHPEAIAALGIREWDAVSLTGSRSTAAVAGVAPPGTPTGTALLDDVTLSNAGLREDTTVIVSAVTVYGARSVTLSGSNLATQSISSATLRQALLGKVMTVGDTVSLLPRELGPDIPTSAATAALASSVGITWTSELLTVTGVDPAGPVSVQPNSVVSWGDGVTPTALATAGQHTVSTPKKSATVNIDDLKGSHAQAGRLTEWLKLALDQPELLETLGATANLGVLVSGPAGVGKADAGACRVRRPAARRTRRARGGRAARRGPAQERLVGGGHRARRRRRAAHHRYRRAAAGQPAEPVAASTLILAELRNAVATNGVAFIATSAVPDGARPTAAGTRPVRPRARAEPARRRRPQATARGAAARRAVRGSSISTKSPSAHRVSSSPIWPHWCGRPRCGRRRGPARTASRRC